MNAISRPAIVPKGPHMAGDFGANLAEDMTEEELSRVAADILEGIEADIDSRTDWESMAEKAIDMLGIEYKAPARELEGGNVSVVESTLILELSIRFWALAEGEFLPAEGPVKVSDDQPAPIPTGPDVTQDETEQQIDAAVSGLTGAQSAGDPQPPGQPPPMGHNGGPPLERADLADALEKDMNHFLTKVDRQYYRDFSRMLFSLGPMGTEFRKVYRCMRRKHPVSEWVRADNLIVSQEAAHLSTALRVTERLYRFTKEVKRLQKQGWWRECELGTPTESPTPMQERVAQAQGTDATPKRPKDNRHEIYECYTEYDLPGFEHPDGDWLPYRITVDKQSKQILEIRRNWREEDEDCKARARYVMFGMIPGLKFYALGLIHLAVNQQRALTAIERILIDSGMFASFPGFLKAKSAGRAGTTDLRVKPGQVKEIELGGLNDIGKAIMKIPYAEPSAALMQIWTTLAEDTRRALGGLEQQVGEGRQDIPVGTMLAQIEQGTKVMAAVHKGLHQSRAEELELLKELFEEDPTALYRFAKTPARRWEQREELADLDLQPSSDPNVPSHLHRIMLAQASLQMAGPQVAPPGLYNMKRLHEDARRVVGLPTDDGIWAPPQPAPSAPPPAVQAAQIKAQSAAQEQQRKAASEVAKLQQETAKSALDAQDAQAQRESNERVALIKAQSEHDRLQAENVRHVVSEASEIHQHHTGLAEDARQHTVDTLSSLASPPQPTEGAQE